MNCTCVFYVGLLLAVLPSVLKAAQPNIVVMMADDMGMGDTSAYQDYTGNADDVQIHTPNMERLGRMGIRFTDAHTPTSRCSGTRYGLLTGRYPWRNRLKHWVLFGAQGDPMIEADRPTIATMLQAQGYRTAIVGKWHVGLRFRQANGQPAAGWGDADLTQPLHTCPLDHGFDFCRITSRSHGTSGPDAGNPDHPKNRGANGRGPGHIHGRRAIAATTGRQLAQTGPHAYVLSELGGRHSDSVLEFLSSHVQNADTQGGPFFLYYPANSNHGPYTPDSDIAGKPVAGAARTKSGKPMNSRHDFIYENDVALGRLLDWLEATDDPRSPGKKLSHNTLVVFTSDNGAEKKSKTATGPFRSNKGSAYEGGHRVPFIVAWPAGNVGDGSATTSGYSSESLIALQDLYATFADIVGAKLPDLRVGEKGAEDSRSVLPAFHRRPLPAVPIFHNDHNESKKDHAACAIRFEQWKLLMNADLIRVGKASPLELYNLEHDRRERDNLVDRKDHQQVVQRLLALATLHRNIGGHRFSEFTLAKPIHFDWRTKSFTDQFASGTDARVSRDGVTMHVHLESDNANGRFQMDKNGLLVSGGERVELSFSEDVLIESVAIAARDGSCGGSYRVGSHSPLAIYCVDADNDAKDQSGILSDLGILKASQTLELNSSPHLGVEANGKWRIQQLSVRRIE